MHAPPLTSCPTWLAAAERDERLRESRKAFAAFWGRDYCRTWTRRLEARVGTAHVGLKLYIYPTIRISWYVQTGLGCTTAGAREGIDYRFVGMTVAETRELAKTVGLDLAALERWLVGAFAVCGCHPERDAWRLG